MADNRQKLVHLHTSDVKMPAQGLLDLGEIAVQHNDVEAALYIEKNNGDIAKFIDVTAVEAKIEVEKLRAEGVEEAITERIDVLSGSNHTHENKDVLDGVTAEKVAAWDAAEANASAYTDSAIANLNLAETYEAKGVAQDLIDDLKLDDTYEAKGVAQGLIDDLKLADTYEAKGTAQGLIDDLNLAETYEAKGTAQDLINDLNLAETYEAKGTAQDLIDDLKLAETYASKDVESTITTLVGEDAGKSVRTVASEEVSKIVNSADASYDTLKEIADWIINDTTGSAQMASDIEALKAISADTRLVALEEETHKHDNKDLLDSYTQTESDLSDAVAKKHAHENKDVLDGVTAEKVAAWDVAEANASAYTDSAIANLNLAETYEAKGTAQGLIDDLKLADTYEAKGTAQDLIDGLKLADTYEAKGVAQGLIDDLNLAETYEAKGTAQDLIDGLKLAETYEAKGTAQTIVNDLKLADTYETKGAAADALTEAKAYTDEQLSIIRIDCGTY